MICNANFDSKIYLSGRGFENANGLLADDFQLLTFGFWHMQGESISDSGIVQRGLMGTSVEDSRFGKSSIQI